MNAKQFRQVIETIVKEEVRKEVANQLPKLLYEMIGQQPKTVVREQVQPTPIQGRSQVKGQMVRNTGDDPEEGPVAQPQPQKKVVKRYAKDPRLNAILNETTPGLPQTPYGDTGVPLPAFDKVGGVSEEFMGEMREIMNEVAVPQPQVVEEVVEETPSAGPDLSKLFNKNFKAILEKSKGRTGGGGNFSNILQSW